MQVFELAWWKIVCVKRAILIVQSFHGNAGFTQTQGKHPRAAYKVLLLWEAGNVEDGAELRRLDSTAHLGTQGYNKKSLIAQHYREDKVPHKLWISAGSQSVNFPWAGSLEVKDITSAACVWTMTKVLFRTRNKSEFAFEYYLGDKGDEWIAAWRYTRMSEFPTDGF